MFKSEGSSEGLGLSLVVYMAAIIGGLALVALPVYLANRETVYENPLLARADPLMNGPIVGNRISERIPLAIIKRETILDPAIVAALNAKAEDTAPARRRVTRQRARPSNRTAAADLPVERKHSSFFLFRLFGG